MSKKGDLEDMRRSQWHSKAKDNLNKTEKNQDQYYHSIKSKCISRKSGLMPCLKTILNCFALEHSAFKTKHLKVS